VKEGTAKYRDTEIRGPVLIVGKTSCGWSYQKDIGGQSRQILIGRYPAISAQAARETALGFMGLPGVRGALILHLTGKTASEVDWAGV